MVNFDRIKELIYRNGAILGLLSAIGGFVADVLQPVAPFAEYVFYVALCIALLAVVLMAVVASMRELALSILVFAVVAAGLSSGLWLLQMQTNNMANGWLAGNVSGVAEFQQAQGWGETLASIQATQVAMSNDVQTLQADTAAMREDTRALAENSAAIQSSTLNLEAQTATIETNTQAIQTSIDGLAEQLGGQALGQGGVIANPQSAEDYYHNARLHELGGDYGNARRAYLQYFRLDNPGGAGYTQLDPHIRFQRFLKIQDGVMGAREIYQGLFNSSQDAVDQYALLLLSPEGQRRAALQQFAQQQPDFAPVYYELALAHSAMRMQTPTLSDQRAELDYWQRFLAAADAGQLQRYFIDNDELMRWLEQAETRMQALSQLVGSDLLEPMKFRVSRMDSSWRIYVTLQEPALQILYRQAGQADYINTGTSGGTNPTTGQAAPRRVLDFPVEMAKQNIQFKYQDANGQMQGPYTFRFDPKKESVAAHIRILSKHTEDWLTFMTPDGYNVIYNDLDQYRCGVKTAWIGYGQRVPDERLELAPCDYDDMFGTSSYDHLEIYLSQPVPIVSMRLEFVDGSQTDTIVFETDFTEDDRESF